MKETIHLTKGRRIVVMQCGFHAYMESWGLAMDHPSSAMTDSDERFTVSDVPPGEGTLEVWHPGVVVTLERNVTVLPKDSVAADFSFAAPVWRRSAHEIMEDPHYGLEALGKPLSIVPTRVVQRP